VSSEIEPVPASAVLTYLYKTGDGEARYLVGVHLLS